MTATEQQRSATSADRIVNLDLVRGVAVLGILLMNIVSFGLGTPAYFNLDAGGTSSALDWIVGICGELFVDQKFMGVFSMLFGAGIVLFHERAMSKGQRAVALSMWRNALLLAIGLVHSAFWDGDILLVYAICAPFVIAARRLSNRALVGLGIAIMATPVLLAVVAQSTVGADGAGLGEYWGVSGAMNDGVGIWLLSDFFLRSLALMLLGIVAYRIGYMSGACSQSLYRRVLVGGGLFGVATAGVGVVWLDASDFGVDVAVVASIPNTIGTIASSMAIIAGITLAGRRWTGAVNARLQAVGRMALTNYLAQTVMAMVTLDVVLPAVTDVELGRAALLVVVFAIWAIQIAWSAWWLDRFRFGPVEWLWRCATYRSRQPLGLTR